MSYGLDEMSWSDVRSVLADDPRLILPVGALEQHGPHLPLGTNITIAQRVAHDVSHRLRILRAPTFSYGVTVGGGPFSGTAGLRRKTLHRAINELIGNWEDHGVQHFVIITAHRFEPHLEALLMTPAGPATKSVYDLYQIEVTRDAGSRHPRRVRKVSWVLRAWHPPRKELRSSPDTSTCYVTPSSESEAAGTVHGHRHEPGDLGGGTNAP